MLLIEYSAIIIMQFHRHCIFYHTLHIGSVFFPSQCVYASMCVWWYVRVCVGVYLCIRSKHTYSSVGLLSELIVSNRRINDRTDSEKNCRNTQHKMNKSPSYSQSLHWLSMAYKVKSCVRPTVSVAIEVTLSLKAVHLTSELSADLGSIRLSSAKSPPEHQ